MPATTRNDYDGIATWYGALAHGYSLGRIQACKRWQLRELAPGDRVLYAGAGGGEDAVLAARLGARVTMVELSPGMLAVAGARFRAAGLEGAIEVLQGDILAHAREGQYDAVVCNFFLNVFEEAVMREVLNHLARQVRTGGKLLLADFAAPGRKPLPRMLRRLYFGLAVRVFRLVANNALHPLYDYVPLLEPAGLGLVDSREFRVLGVGLYRTLTAVRSQQPT